MPAAFGVLWLAQYSLVMVYFDNAVFAFAGSVFARVGGLAIFVYVWPDATSRTRKTEVEAREAT